MAQPKSGEGVEEAFLDILETGITQDAKEKGNVRPEDVGMVAEVKPLYQSTSSYCSCCTIWDDERPKERDDHELHALAEKERRRYAILKKQTRHGRGAWKVASIEINSHLIRERMETIFVDYPSVDTRAATLSFEPPFLPFIHRWDRFSQVCDTQTDQGAREHLALLREVLGPEAEKAFATLDRIQKTGYAAFHELVYLYIAGEVVVQDVDGVVSAGVLRAVQLAENKGFSWYTFSVDVVDWNGEKFGVKTQCWAMPEYPGSRKVTDLMVLPLRAHADVQGLKKTLISRGRKFEALRGQHLMSYAGKAAVHLKKDDSYGDDPTDRGYYPISERVIIDAGTHYRLRHKTPENLRPLEEISQTSTTNSDQKEYDGYEDDASAAQIAGRYGPPSALRPRQIKAATTNEGFSASISITKEQEKLGLDDSVLKIRPLTDEECLFSVPWVRAFALDSKLWCELDVTLVQDIAWNTSALSNLVLGEEEKRLVTAMVASRTQQEDSFDDFIDGKGRGIIILLKGPPGVGKTLTAESVAEHLKQPLYRLGAADLGSTITTVETRLKEVLLRCAAWNALLLIDEADVFLEARTTDSLERNELISVFLRLLEYYTGILILTTNRHSVIDPAFESRIDIALNYTTLTAASQTEILGKFIARLPADRVDLTHDEMAALMAERSWNGRQIKSAVKTARILAASEGAKLGVAHLRIVLGIRQRAAETTANGGSFF